MIQLSLEIAPLQRDAIIRYRNGKAQRGRDGRF